MRQLPRVNVCFPLCIVAVVSLTQVATADSQPKTITYKVVGDVEIMADVYGADESAPRPVIAWFHGGALIMGSRTAVPKQVIELSQRQGFLLISFDYRLAPQAKLPEIIEDLKDGLNWIRTSGPKLFKADPSKMVVAGASAGGYLAMMSGITIDPPPTAIVSYYGFADVDGKWTTEPNENFLAGTPISEEDAWAAVGDRIVTNTDETSGEGRWKFFAYLKQTGLWAEVTSGFDPATERDKLTPFCPIRNLSLEYPPILMLHGTADKDVPYQKSVEMARELTGPDEANRLSGSPAEAKYGQCFPTTNVPALAGVNWLSPIGGHYDAELDSQRHCHVGVLGRPALASQRGAPAERPVDQARREAVERVGLQDMANG